MGTGGRQVLRTLRSEERRQKHVLGNGGGTAVPEHSGTLITVAAVSSKRLCSPWPALLLGRGEHTPPSAKGTERPACAGLDGRQTRHTSFPEKKTTWRENAPPVRGVPLGEDRGRAPQRTGLMETHWQAKSPVKISIWSTRPPGEGCPPSGVFSALLTGVTQRPEQGPEQPCTKREFKDQRGLPGPLLHWCEWGPPK